MVGGQHHNYVCILVLVGSTWYGLDGSIRVRPPIPFLSFIPCAQVESGEKDYPTSRRRSTTPGTEIASGVTRHHYTREPNVQRLHSAPFPTLICDAS
jgi:hypothetical protein